MTSTAVAQLRLLQKSLYEKAYKEAHSLVAGSSRTILSYSAKFEKSLPRRFSRSTLAELHEALRRHRFVLYGDFHTLRQSQRGLIRLLRSFTERQRSSKVVIALEMFKAIDQDFIDGYLAGRLKDERLLDSVNYQTEWGFPWPNFRMILDFARARHMPVVGVNTENAGRDALAARDRYAAKRLADAAERYPDHRIVCLIGEYHLADGHLPKALSAELKRRHMKTGVLRILNNVDQYFFSLQQEAAYGSTEYLKLKRDFYCIMNSPPWMKWQSFSLWEETRHAGLLQLADADTELGGDFDGQSEDGFDVDFQFLHFVRNLANFMALKIDPSDMESFHIHYSPEGNFYKNLTQDDQITPTDAEHMIGRALTDGVYFLTRSNTVLLTYISINNLAEAAGQYLHHLLSGFDDTAGTTAEAFYRRILKAAAGMLASKILNPRRKCQELHHFRQFVRRKGRATADEAPDPRLEAAHAVLRFDKWLVGRIDQGKAADFAAPPRTLVLLDEALNYEVSRLIGQMLGFNLYKKIIANKEPSSRIRRLFRRGMPTPDAVWSEVTALYRLVLR